MGHIFLEKSKFTIADSLLQESMKRLKKIYGNQHPYISRTKLNKARLYVGQKQMNKAKQLLISVNKEYNQIYPPDHPRQSDPMLELGKLYLNNEAPHKAKEFLEKAHQIRVHGYPEGSWRIAQTMSAFGECNSKLGEYKKADSLLVKSFAQLEKKRGSSDKYTLKAKARLINHYKKWKKTTLLEKYLNL